MIEIPASVIKLLYKIFGFAMLVVNLVIMLLLLAKILVFGPQTVTGNKVIVIVEMALLIYGFVFVCTLINKERQGK